MWRAVLVADGRKEEVIFLQVSLCVAPFAVSCGTTARSLALPYVGECRVAGNVRLDHPVCLIFFKAWCAPLVREDSHDPSRRSEPAAFFARFFPSSGSRALIDFKLTLHGLGRSHATFLRLWHTLGRWPHSTPSSCRCAARRVRRERTTPYSPRNGCSTTGIFWCLLLLGASLKAQTS